jgi:hypothetical protein
MLSFEVTEKINAIERDMGELATHLAWNSLQHIANSAVRKMEKVDGDWVTIGDEQRLRNIRDAMLMELIGESNDDAELCRIKVVPYIVEALYIGLGSKPLIRVKTLSGLPEWMQARVTVLSMLTQTPPSEPVEGVGRRLSADIYWIVK